MIENVAEFMAKGNDVRKGSWTAQQVELINGLHLLTAKPMIYLANMSEEDYQSNENKFLPLIQKWVDENNKGDLIIPLSVMFESKVNGRYGVVEKILGFQTSIL